jgi:putative tricarboxylic transport membrane protein
METLQLLANGFDVAFSWNNLFYCLIGVSLGTFIGVLPGIGALASMSMLLPITFHLDPTAAIIMLAGVYYGAEYGGSTASILLNLPGTTANAVTCLDGYPMAQQGRAGVALFMTTIASFVGGTLGILVLMLLTPLVIMVALSFGPAEYVAVIVFGLIAAGTVAQGSPLKGIMMIVLGVLIGCIGADMTTGTVRYSLGFYELQDGVSIVILAMGLFGVAEVISAVNREVGSGLRERISLRSMLPSGNDLRRSLMPMLRGTVSGSIFGPLPGAGPSLAAFMAYIVEKRVSRTPERFGKGAIEGIAAPEAANNASVQTAFVPTLTLGVPGTATMAIMMGALMIHGIQPGPRLVTQMPDLFWGVVASFWIGNVLLLVLNIPMIGVWVSILRIPYRFLYPAVLCFICIGVYSIHNNVFDVYLVIIVGLIGYFLRVLAFEPAPLLIGFILGPMLEANFRRGMLMFRGDASMFLQRPISGVLLAAAALTLIFIAWSSFRKRAQRNASQR